MNLTPNVSVLQSELWQTNTGIIRGPQGTVLVDPGIFPAERDAIVAEAGEVVAGFCTHAHWDHVLWDARFGTDVPRFAVSKTIALIHKDRDRILNNLTNMEQYLRETGQTCGEELWDRSLLFAEQPIAWGEGSIAGIPMESIHIPGHEDGQAALMLPDHRVCFVADTLSDIETPSVHNGIRSIALYLDTLDRLESLISRVDWIIPGHGAPCSPDEAMRRLIADRAYLQHLIPAVMDAEAGEGAEEVARRILTELGEERAQSELAWSMHLDNVQQLVAERELRSSDLKTRQSARIILLDADYRVWMLRINDPIRPRWILPGGGMEAGESLEETARREMFEECAVDDAEIGPMVATRDAIGQLESIGSYRAKEHYFIAHLNRQSPSGTNMLPHEVEDYTQQAWFSAEDIRASNEVVYPLGLADLLDQLKRGEIPSKPIAWMD